MFVIYVSVVLRKGRLLQVAQERYCGRKFHILQWRSASSDYFMNPLATFLPQVVYHGIPGLLGGLNFSGEYGRFFGLVALSDGQSAQLGPALLHVELDTIVPMM